MTSAANGYAIHHEAGTLRHAVMQRRNALVARGTSTGKTTLVNALLADVAVTSDRVVLIEDTCELPCKALNLVTLPYQDGVTSPSDFALTSAAPRPRCRPADQSLSRRRKSVRWPSTGHRCEWNKRRASPPRQV